MTGGVTTRSGRARFAAVGSWLWAVLAVLPLGCDRADGPTAADRPVPADRVVDFRTLYGENCAGCHGADGKLGPAPPLNDPIFLSIVPDAVVMDLISRGRPGTPMPAFARRNGGPLTDDQVRALTAGIKPCWGSASPVRQDLPPYAAGAAEAGADEERGHKVFARACGCLSRRQRGGEGREGRRDPRPGFPQADQ